MAETIEHTRLAADTTPRDVEAQCQEAIRYGFAGVCLNPVYVPLAVRSLRGSHVRVVTVVGFPLGANTLAVDAYAAARALDDGAEELDLVLPLGFALAGDIARVEQHVAEVRRATGDAVLKVILETGYFAAPLLETLAQQAVAAGADYLKTSTGFGPRGASEADVALLSRVARAAARPVRVKASGGIRTLEQARSLLAAGATRLGTSRGVELARAELG